MNKFNLINQNNYLLFKTEGKTFVLDTGAHITLSKRGEVNFLGSHYQTPKKIGTFGLEELGGYIGTNTDVLLGYDILSKYEVLIDLGNGQVTFASKPIELEGKKCYFKSYQGVPVIDFELDRSTYRAFLDTGAPMSFLRKSMTGDMTVSGRLDDFFPNYGRFSTPTYNASLKIADARFQSAIGTFPSEVESAVTASGVDGIIGYDFFNSYKVLINYKEQCVTFS